MLRMGNLSLKFLHGKFPPETHHAEARFLLDVLFKAIWILENERIRIGLEHHLAVLGHVICFFLLSSKVDPLPGAFGAEVRRIF